MKHSKREKAEYLLREIGHVRDVFLVEAMADQGSSQRRPRRIGRVLALAACLLLAVTVSMSGVLRRYLLPHGNGGGEGKPTDVLTLDSLLLQTRSEGAFGECSYDALDFFGGRGYVVWQYGEEETLCYSRPLQANELQTLVDEIDRGEQVGEAVPALDCRVWILLGNGEVLSPYLANTDGNRAAATLADYEAELIPSEEFVSSLSEILNTERMD